MPRFEFSLPDELARDFTGMSRTLSQPQNHIIEWALRLFLQGYKEGWAIWSEHEKEGMFHGVTFHKEMQALLDQFSQIKIEHEDLQEVAQDSIRKIQEIQNTHTTNEEDMRRIFAVLAPWFFWAWYLGGPGMRYLERRGRPRY